MNNTIKKGLNNIKYSLLYQLVTICLGIILPRLVIVSLGSEANGLINSINQIIVYLALFEGGMGLSITKALYGPVASKDIDEINSIVSAANIFYKKIGTYYFIGLLAIAIIYPMIISTTFSRFTVFLVIMLTGFPQVINFYIQGKYRTLISIDGKQYFLTFLSTIVYIFTSLLKILLLLNGFGIIAIQFLYLCINLVQMIFIMLYVKKEFPWLNLNVKPNMVAIGKRKSVFLHQISGFIFSNSDMIIIAYFCDLKMVSVYAMYNMLFNMVNTLGSSITNSFVFAMGQNFNTDKGKYIKWNRLFESFNLATVFALQFVTYICIIPFLNLYTKGINDVNYIDQILPTLFVIINLILSGRFSSQKTIEYAGEFEKTQIHAVIEAIINIIVSIIGVHFLGIYGVLIGTIVALVFRSILMIYYSNVKILNIPQKTTYIKWVINSITFIILCKVHYNFNIIFDSYYNLIIYAILMCVLSIFVFCGIGILCDRNLFEFLIDYINRGLGHDKKSNIFDKN